MKKIKFMLLSLALVAVVGGALAFKAKYVSTFCTTYATRTQASDPWTCQLPGQAILSCPTTIELSTVAGPEANQPVCTANLFQGTCGTGQRTVPCQIGTKTIIPN